MSFYTFRIVYPAPRLNLLIPAILTMLALLLIFGSPTLAAAQEETATPEVTADVTVAPEPSDGDVIVNPGEGDVIINPPAENPTQPTDNTLYVIGLILFLVVYGVREFITTRQIGSLVETVNKALDNKQVQDEAQRRYMEASLSTQEFIKLARSIFSFLGAANIPVLDPTFDKASDFLGTVTQPGDLPTTPSNYSGELG